LWRFLLRKRDLHLSLLDFSDVYQQLTLASGFIDASRSDDQESSRATARLNYMPGNKPEIDRKPGPGRLFDGMSAAKVFREVAEHANE
jgi:hypothetical protein